MLNLSNFSTPYPQGKSKPKKTSAKTPKVEEVRSKEVKGHDHAEQNANGEESMEVPDPSDPSGFQQGLVAQEIMGATEMEGHILFLIKW